MSDLAHLHVELLSAVHQQFTHMLILERLGERDLAAGIKAADDEDFKTSMVVTERLADAASFTAPAHLVRFGGDVETILALEAAMETRLRAALEAGCEDAEIARRAEAPRIAYGEWLRSRGATEFAENGGDAIEDGLIVDLLSLMELSLTNAYRRRVAGEADAADREWRICGASMMHLMAIARFASEPLVDERGFLVPEMRFSVDTSANERLEREIAGRCAEAADREAARSPKAAKLLRRIAEDCRAIEATPASEPLRLTLGDSRAFDDFERSRRLADA